MAMQKMTKPMLKERLEEIHGEPVPKAWSKSQILLRLVELEGEEIMLTKKSTRSHLRQLEIDMNKAARKKEDLRHFVVQRLGTQLTFNETIEQLKVKGLSRMYEITDGHPTDLVGFGKHSDKTYQELALKEPTYLQWAIKTKNEGDTCQKLQRLAAWAETEEGMAWMQMGMEDSMAGYPAPKTPTKEKSYVKDSPLKSLKSSPAASSQSSAMEGMFMEMMNQVKTLTQEVQELKGEKARKTRSKRARVLRASGRRWKRPHLTSEPCRGAKG